MYNKIKRITKTIKMFFCEHYRIIPEHQMDDYYEIPDEARQITYDEEAIREDFKKENLFCDNCNCYCPTELIITPQYGNRGITIERKSTCVLCNKILDITLRLKNGYIMEKDKDGNWFCIVLEKPLIVSWLGAIKDLITGQN